jgi:hypothetical protein
MAEQFLRTFALLLSIFLAIAGASASIQSQISQASAGPVEVVSGDYTENVKVNKPFAVIGIDNPRVTADNSAVSTFSVTSSNVTLTSFTITGASGARGIEVSNSSPRIAYNNILGNGQGLWNHLVEKIDARHCYWGPGGSGLHRGEPGAGSNNVILGEASYAPWLTAEVANGRVSLENGSPNIFNNPEAGVKIELTGGTSDRIYMGSASYLSTPYSSSPVPAKLVRFVDAFVHGNVGGTAKVTISYSDPELAGVVESSLEPIIWTGTNWTLARDVVRDLTTNQISGSFPSWALIGNPIAVVGQDYSVTVLPGESPEVPVTTKPVFSTFRIESTTDLDEVSYQIDGVSRGGWKVIQSDIDAKVWNWPGWGITDEEWSSLSDGTHSIYFSFTRRAEGAVGRSGELLWIFTKSRAMDGVILLSPNGGEVLNRQPFQIEWVMAHPEKVDTISLYYSKDGGFSYPYPITKLVGGVMGYSWRSPNIRADQARMMVVVRYLDGTERSDQSDGYFSIQRGYTFFSRRPDFGYTSFKAALLLPRWMKAHRSSPWWASIFLLETLL